MAFPFLGLRMMYFGVSSDDDLFPTELPQGGSVPAHLPPEVICCAAHLSAPSPEAICCAAHLSAPSPEAICCAAPSAAKLAGPRRFVAPEAIYCAEGAFIAILPNLNNSPKCLCDKELRDLLYLLHLLRGSAHPELFLSRIFDIACNVSDSWKGEEAGWGYPRNKCNKYNNSPKCLPDKDLSTM